MAGIAALITLPNDRWLILFIDFISGSRILLKVNSGAVAGRGKLNGQLHSHKSGAQNTKGIITTEISTDVPEPTRPLSATEPAGEIPNCNDKVP